MAQKLRRKSRQVRTRRKKSVWKSRHFLFIGFIVAVIVGILFIHVKNSSIDPTTPEIANPASVNCIKKGGRVDIRQDVNGAQYGMCVFENGKECEEWALFTDNVCRKKY